MTGDLFLERKYPRDRSGAVSLSTSGVITIAFASDLRVEFTTFCRARVFERCKVLGTVCKPQHAALISVKATKE